MAWLEDNPPHSILLPRVIPPTSDAISYRDKGYLEKGKVKKSPDKASKAMSYCQNAVESLLLTWQWDENPNQEVINTLNLLCGEVPYLGEACSVVELKVIAGGGIPEVQRDKTWTLEKGPMLSGISRHNRVFAVPGTGRLEELKRAYMAANPEGKGKGKNAAKSKIRTKEAEQNFLELSPVTVLFGGWDSTRSKNQLRIPSVLTGEMYGVLADQSDDDPAIHRAGARIDPVGASVSVAKKADREKIVGDSIDLSENTKNKFIGSGKGSIIGLGAIPPSADKGALDGVSVRGIVSSRVLSFTMLRTFHFGKGVEGDAAIRALIAAALLRAMAGYDENPVVRANCALTETGKPSVVLNKRYGEKEEFEPLTAESTEKLLEEAYTQAREKAGIVWNGQEFLVQGNPAVFDNASAEE